ncbi:hypothetical protein OUZ56_021506, partial [Daphnia magna]
IYPRQPTTAAEFFELLKVHTETSLLLEKRTWSEKSPTTSPQIAVVRQEPQESDWKTNLDLRLYN